MIDRSTSSGSALALVAVEGAVFNGHRNSSLVTGVGSTISVGIVVEEGAAANRGVPVGPDCTTCLCGETVEEGQAFQNNRLPCIDLENAGDVVAGKGETVGECGRIDTDIFIHRKLTGCKCDGAAVEGRVEGNDTASRGGRECFPERSRTGVGVRADESV